MMKLLLIEDSIDMLTVIQEVIKDTFKGIEVTVAMDGEKGLELFNKDNYDLVITDYQMPIKNGIEFVTAVRKTDAVTPVVMFSASWGIEEDAKKAGVTKLVAKQDVDELMKEIDIRFEIA